MIPIFITGIGTGIGKTLVSAIVTEALEADYWKPIQAGFDDGTDALQVGSLISNTKTTIYPEVYKLKLPASPHIAAREEGTVIDLEGIVNRYSEIARVGNRESEDERRVGNRESEITSKSLLNIHDSRLTTYALPLIIEGAGGIMVLLNDNEFIIDLIEQLQARVILVSRNYLGSINHSLLTAAICKQRNIDVIGWIFNDQYLNYEEEIVRWTGYPKIASIPFVEKIDKTFVSQQAALIKESLLKLLLL